MSSGNNTNIFLLPRALKESLTKLLLATEAPHLAAGLGQDTQWSQYLPENPIEYILTNWEHTVRNTEEALPCLTKVLWEMGRRDAADEVLHYCPSRVAESKVTTV